MSVDRNYYVIAGFDLTNYKTKAYDDWRWTEDAEKYTCNQCKGEIQLFDDPMSGYHLYLGNVLAAGDEYDFKTTKVSISDVEAARSDVVAAVRYLKEIGIISESFDEADAYRLIMFEECT